MTLIIVLLLSMKLNAQLVKLNAQDYNNIKESTLHFVLTNNVLYDSILKNSVTKYWTSSKYDFISKDDFLKLGSDEGQYFAVLDFYGQKGSLGGGYGFSNSLNKLNTSTTESYALNAGTSRTLSYEDNYSIFTITKGVLDREKREVEKFIKHGEWLVTIINEHPRLYPYSSIVLKNNFNIIGDTIPYADPLNYKLELDVRSLQFLLEYSKGVNKVGFGAVNTYYPFPKAKSIRNGKLYILKEDWSNKIDSLKMKKIYPYSYEIIDRKQLLDKIKKKEENAVLVDYCRIGSSTNVFTFINISDGELLYFNFLRGSSTNWKWMFKYLDKKVK